jgi:hypothetical protein
VKSDTILLVLLHQLRDMVLTRYRVSLRG